MDIRLSQGDTYSFGNAGGLFVVQYPSGNSQHFLCLIDNYSRKVTHIAGLDPNNTGAFEFVFEGTGYATNVLIKSKATLSNAQFKIAYQQI